MNFKKGAVAISLGAAALLAGTGLTVSSAWLITMAAAHPPILVLGVSIVLVRFFGISRSVARYAERLYSHEAVFGGLTSLRIDIYQRLTSSSSEFVRRVDMGGLVKSIVDNLERAQEFALRVTLPSKQAIVAIGISNLISFWIYPPLLFIFVPISILLLFVIPALISRSHLSLAGEIEEIEDRYAQAVENGVIATIEAEIYGFASALLRDRSICEDQALRAEKVLHSRNRTYQLLTQLLISASLIGSALIAISADYLAPVKISMAIFLPLVAFEAITLWYPNLYQSGKLLRAQQGLDELKRTYPGMSEKAKSEITPDGVIILDHVRVAWSDKFAKPVTFSAKAGDVVVIKGESGSGKTTLAMAALGMLDYQGSIRVSGEEVSNLANLHRHIVASLQSGHIFNTSIRENLKIANPSAEDSQLREALSLVELPDVPLDEVVGEFGRKLSGGEAKRLAVARALISPAPIIILDEPTEHLDAELAHRLEQSIANFCSNRTLIVITHSGWLNSSKTVEVERE